MKRILFTMLAAGACTAAMAIPAKPGIIKYTQPEGSVIEFTMVGDEHGHVLYSQDGLVLLEASGRMEYARFNADGFPVPSGVAVRSKALKSSDALALQTPEQIEKWAGMLTLNKDERLEKLRKAVLARKAAATDENPDNTDDPENPGEPDNPDNPGDPDDPDNPGGDTPGGEEPPAGDDDRLVPLNFGRCNSTFPVLGEQKGLVVLVEYQDLAFKYGDFDYFNRMLNEEGFSDNGSLSSVRDWFIYNSNGQFVPDFDVYGPVLLPEKRSYYGGNDYWGNDENPHMMAIHALEILDEEVDFSQYDRDGDGKIDNVFIFYAGKGEHDSSLSNAVWPHSWDISAAGLAEDYVFDGVVLDHYACTCEYPNGYKRADGIGTFIHEFSHVMGLPDLYVTNYGGGFTPGEWSVLDVGPYNNDRLTPPNYSSYEKCALGWIDMIPLEEGIMELPNFAESNVAYVLPTEKDNEFFFFENRQQVGNDAFIPGHGMLVWHIDYQKSAWDTNTVNNKSTHQMVDIVEADNKKTEKTRGGDAFPGTSEVTEFHFNSKPRLISWGKKELALGLRDIEETEDGIIRFNAFVSGGSDDPGAVEEVVSVDTTGKECFDLMGRKVKNPGKGIYIIDGKKVIR